MPLDWVSLALDASNSIEPGGILALRPLDSTPLLNTNNLGSAWPNWTSDVLTVHNIVGIHYVKVSRGLYWHCLTVSPWLASLAWVSFFACPSKKSQMCGGWGEVVLVHPYWKSVGPLAGWMNKSCCSSKMLSIAKSSFAYRHTQVVFLHWEQDPIDWGHYALSQFWGGRKKINK